RRSLSQASCTGFGDRPPVIRRGRAAQESRAAPRVHQAIWDRLYRAASRRAEGACGQAAAGREPEFVPDLVHPRPRRPRPQRPYRVPRRRERRVPQADESRDNRDRRTPAARAGAVVVTVTAHIDPVARIGAVHLTISDLGRSIRFYESHLGFTLHGWDERTARLGAGDADLLVLSQCETAPRVRGTTGLYHFAILVPSRADLARSLRRLVMTETVLQGAAGHGVSEALYLSDPDGNGIEIYRDRPKTGWPYVGGHLRMGADPLDLDDLLAEKSGAGDDAGLAASTVIGHVHLHVRSLADAERFYVN